MKGYLQLENGLLFEGELFGDTRENILGEVVFNTSMTGYEEILTDPSYYGQIVTLTYPLIGNYGINYDYEESNNIKARGLIVREFCDFPNNYNNEMTLDHYLKNNNVVGLSEIDTRMLTKVLRDFGVMKGIITKEPLSKMDLKIKLDTFDNKDAVKNVSTKKQEKIDGTLKRIAVLDFGIKRSIIEMFKERALEVILLPYDTNKEEILNLNADALFLSNGPGDPKDVKDSINTIKELIGVLPIFGICLGHQLVSLALGGDTKKLKFGHRGANHPVKNLETGEVLISSQNHGYVVTKLPDTAQVTYININDQTIEGMKDEEKNIYTVQFHPEASPGPLDAKCIFDEFLEKL